MDLILIGNRLRTACSAPTTPLFTGTKVRPCQLVHRPPATGIRIAQEFDIGPRMQIQVHAPGQRQLAFVPVQMLAGFMDPSATPSTFVSIRRAVLAAAGAGDGGYTPVIGSTLRSPRPGLRCMPRALAGRVGAASPHTSFVPWPTGSVCPETCAVRALRSTRCAPLATAIHEACEHPVPGRMRAGAGRGREPVSASADLCRTLCDAMLSRDGRWQGFGRGPRRRLLLPGEEMGW